MLITRKERLLGADIDIFGWSHYLDSLLISIGSSPVGYMIDDGTVSIGVALTLFMIPASKQTGGRLMDWEDAKKIPWGILLLFGGGLAIAKGFTTSGLSDYVATQLAVLLGDASPLVIVISTVTFITGLTEVASNTATISLSLPMMASLSQAIGAHPFLLLILSNFDANSAYSPKVKIPLEALQFMGFSESDELILTPVFGLSGSANKITAKKNTNP